MHSEFFHSNQGDAAIVFLQIALSSRTLHDHQ